MDDRNAWCLSDPKEEPEESFEGTTVVLVPPNADRVDAFLTQDMSERYYMPVWERDKLLDCRDACFPEMPVADVDEAFGLVGGVAREVFDRLQLERMRLRMKGIC